MDLPIRLSKDGYDFEIVPSNTVSNIGIYSVYCAREPFEWSFFGSADTIAECVDIVEQS